MKNLVFWLVLILITGGALAAILGFTGTPPPPDNPRAHLPLHAPQVNHAGFFSGPFKDPHAVTRACLNCHPDAAGEIMATSHWTWESGELQVPGHKGLVRVGKRNLINNFCISVIGNWPRCTSCHIGYGWEDMSFDFKKKDNVDCLVCHDNSGLYVKDPKGAGYPMKNVNLLACANSVGLPKRRNCGSCHFRGGGGDAVKHGDLDNSLILPTVRVDIHMGKYGFECIDCHRTRHHRLPGAAMSVTPYKTLRVECTDCHAKRPHADERLNAHVTTVACQTCHIPYFAIDDPTKMTWDWSEAGKNAAQLKKDKPELFRRVMEHWNPPEEVKTLPPKEREKKALEFFMEYLTENHLYLKIKGVFTLAENVKPEYYWYNGKAYRYLKGDKIDPSRHVVLVRPLGNIKDPAAKIYPFKVHRAIQPYDKKFNYLLFPKLYGKGGFWSDFDWEKAFRLGAKYSKLPYSGEYGWVHTDMWWPIDHMVAHREKALQCVDCHSPKGRLDWKALGYDGDPAFSGTRFFLEMPLGCKETKR